jgi:phosphatidylglycerol:prolipoprotein diacylglycerol transferase
MIPYIRIPDIDLQVIKLHPFGILVATGVLVATGITTRRARRLGYDLHRLNSFVTWMLVAGFIGGHMFDEVMYHFDELVRRPLSIFYLWEGLSSFGGFLGALIGIVLWKYLEWRKGFIRVRAAKQPLLPFADLVLSVFPVGWAFGRSGCSVVHDHPGARTTADNILAVAYPLNKADGPVTKIGFIELVHGHDPHFDMGLLELMFTLVLLACFVATWRRKVPVGTYTIVTALAYAPVRFALDSLRLPEAEGGDPRYDLLDMLLRAIHVRAKDAPPLSWSLSLTPAQWFCLALFTFGLVMLYRVIKMRARGEDPAAAVRVAPQPPLPPSDEEVRAGATS